MAKEIERKFVLLNDQWLQHVDATRSEAIVQGYVHSPDATMRVRLSSNLISKQEQAFLTLKGKRNPAEEAAIDRDEWEYAIPVADAKEMLAKLCYTTIRKHRHHLQWQGKDWTVDVFDEPKLRGLVLAEVELTSAKETVELPPFLSTAAEVTKDGRFSNRALAEPNADLSFLKPTFGIISKAIKGQLG